MKKIVPLALMAQILILSDNTSAQQTSQPDVSHELIKKSARQKTLASWDLLGLLYQVSIDDITADDKSITFKSTLYGIHMIFDSTVATSNRYQQLSFQRYFEPSLNYKYKNNFSPGNLSVGFNYAFIHKNDVSTDRRLNRNSEVFRYIQQLEDGPLTILNTILLRDAAKKSSDPSVQNIIFTQQANSISKFITKGDSSVLNDDPFLRHLIDSLPAVSIEGTTITLLEAVIELQKKIDTIYQQVENDWNATVSPTISYGFSNHAIQGYELAFKVLKGFKLFSDIKRTSALIIKASYKIGDDSLVEKIETNRRQITDEVGINQVLFTKSIKGDDGSSSQKPCVEVSLTGGYNWVMSGLADGEKGGQPALNAKLGFLLGKESWIVFPFNYNFSTKKSFASVSMKVNLGDPPFK